MSEDNKGGRRREFELPVSVWMIIALLILLVPAVVISFTNQPIP